MKIKKAQYISADDFLSGKLDDVLTVINGVLPEGDKYTPYNANLLSQTDIRRIFNTNSQLAHLKSLWFANIGRNGMTAQVNREVSERSRERIQTSLYNFVFGQLKWSKLRREIINRVFEEGNAVIWKNKSDKWVVESIFRFNVYWDDSNKEAVYAYKDSRGQEVEGLKNLRHGVDLWHVKDPLFEDRPVAPARVNLAYIWLLLEQNGVKANNRLFANGMIGTILLGLNPEAAKSLGSVPEKIKGKPNKNSLTRLQIKLREIWDSVTGVAKANIVHSLPGLEKIFEPGKDNKSMQFVELIKDIAPEKIAWAWNITLADLGAGDNTSYNNTKTFSYVLYFKIGKLIEESTDDCLNSFMLPNSGIKTSIFGDLCILCDEPSNPDKIEEIKQLREDLLANAITINEYRDELNRPPVEGGDVYIKDWVGTGQLVESEPDKPTLDVQNKKKDEPCECGHNHLVEFKKPNIGERALQSDLYKGSSKKKGFLQRWEQAIAKQLNEFLSDFSKVTDLEGYEVKLPKIESFYSFPTLKNDLLKFAGLAMDDFIKDMKRRKRKGYELEKFFDGEYPPSVIEAIEKRTEMLLKGLDTYGGVDAETTMIISSFIAEHASEGVNKLARMIQDLIPGLSLTRAELIASTEVVEAIEGTRENMYLEEFPEGGKAWSTGVFDVCPICKGNEDQGIIAIDKPFKSGHTRPSAHPRCGCYNQYYSEDEI